MVDLVLPRKIVRTKFGEMKRRVVAPGNPQARLKQSERHNNNTLHNPLFVTLPREGLIQAIGMGCGVTGGVFRTINTRFSERKARGRFNLVAPLPLTLAFGLSRRAKWAANPARLRRATIG